MNYTFFWKTNERYGCLSNWFEASFVIDGINYNSAEQYMMFKKALLFNDAENASKIMDAASPKICKALGKKVKPFDSAIWDQHKYNIVYDGIKAKFEQNPDIRAVLLATGDSILVEASPFDNIWGIGLTARQAKEISPEEWPGQNLLGKILMDVRKALENSVST